MKFNELMEGRKMEFHKCTDCKTKYKCTADECDEPYILQCTACEIRVGNA